MTNRIWQPIWRVLGSAPLWLKIMGTVVFPLLLIVSVAILIVRQEIVNSLIISGHQEVLSTIYAQLTLQTAFTFSLTILVGMGLAFALSRILAQPLQQLLAVMHQVESGDLGARVGIWARDEIGQVQAAFNNMTTQLEQAHWELSHRNRELTVVNEIASSISFRLRLDDAIEAALNSLMALVEADVGSIYLVQEKDQTLYLKALRGDISDELIQQVEQRKIASSPMRRVLDSRRAVALDDLHTALELPEELANVIAGENLKAWACAPLQLEGKVIGVVNLLKRGQAGFGQDDLALLEAVGNVIGVGLSNTQLLEDLQHKEVELRRALRRAVELQEEERHRLARELHDEIGQALTSILIQLRTLQEEQDLATITDRLDGLRYLTAQMIEELHHLSMDLRPATLDSLGVVPALRWYTQKSAERSGLNIKFVGPEKLERLSPETELTLYRVAQEGLTNAIRHSHAREITLTLERSQRAIWLTISDDGQGFDPAALDRGLGLIGVRERVELLHGNCGINTALGAGTQLWIELPFTERATL